MGIFDSITSGVEKGAGKLIEAVFGAFGRLVKEGVKALGPLAAGMIESLITVLFLYIEYAVKKLIVPILEYGGIIMCGVGFIATIFFFIVLMMWSDRKYEAELKKSNGQAYTQYKTLKFKYGIGFWSSVIVTLLGAVAYVSVWQRWITPPDAAPDLSHAFKPFEAALK